ncbi:MAG: hypothetical protein ACOX45_09955 [Acutalibacteraceae bacterium]
MKRILTCIILICILFAFASCQKSQIVKYIDDSTVEYNGTIYQEFKSREDFIPFVDDHYLFEKNTVNIDNDFIMDSKDINQDFISSWSVLGGIEYIKKSAVIPEKATNPDFVNEVKAVLYKRNGETSIATIDPSLIIKIVEYFSESELQSSIEYPPIEYDYIEVYGISDYYGGAFHLNYNINIQYKNLKCSVVLASGNILLPDDISESLTSGFSQ